MLPVLHLVCQGCCRYLSDLQTLTSVFDVDSSYLIGPFHVSLVHQAGLDIISLLSQGSLEVDTYKQKVVTNDPIDVLICIIPVVTARAAVRQVLPIGFNVFIEISCLRAIS